MDEHLEVLQRHNRAVRLMNQKLRRLISLTTEEMDVKVALLMDNTQAQEALEKIRALGAIDCDPDDYETIVQSCLNALNKNKTTPIGQ